MTLPLTIIVLGGLAGMLVVGGLKGAILGAMFGTLIVGILADR